MWLMIGLTLGGMMGALFTIGALGIWALSYDDFQTLY